MTAEILPSQDNALTYPAKSLSLTRFFVRGCWDERFRPGGIIGKCLVLFEACGKSLVLV